MIKYKTLTVLSMLLIASSASLARENDENNDNEEISLKGSPKGTHLVLRLSGKKISDEDKSEYFFTMGKQYCSSDNTNIYDEKGLEWYHKAAEKNHSGAQFEIGHIYHVGRQGVEKDYEVALKWYLKAAEKNNDNAQAHIGIIYQNGQGVEKDYKVALEWYHKAAEKNNIHAQFHLAVMYFNGGFGLKKDEIESKKWYIKAAAQGHPIDKTIISYFGL